MNILGAWECVFTSTYPVEAHYNYTRTRRYVDFDLLLRMPFTEGLSSLSLRCMQPIQQQGRRLPLLRSATTRATCLSRVFCCLTDIVQQIHSLRASGVKSSHRSSADSSASIAWRKSVGIVCATPLEISDLDINPSYAG